MQERFLEGKKHTGKKALLVGYLIRLLRSQNLEHTKKVIPNCAGMKKSKARNMLKQWRDNFQLGGKDKLNLKLTVFFTSRKSRPVFSEIWKF